MQNGRIVEQGTHEELMELRAAYHSIANDYKQHPQMENSMDSTVPSMHIYKVSLIKRMTS